jgi:large subunit ribosomal protein L19
MAKAKAPLKTKTKTKKAAKTGVETNLVRRVTAQKKNPQVAEFRAGDTVNVFVKVKEGEKERVQVYKGVVTKLQGAGAARSFTVRKISAGVGVERTFPFTSPAIEKVELLNIGQVRRAKLYYLRGLEGKAAKIESELVSQSSAAETAATTEA